PTFANADRFRSPVVGVSDPMVHTGLRSTKKSVLATVLINALHVDEFVVLVIQRHQQHSGSVAVHMEAQTFRFELLAPAVLKRVRWRTRLVPHAVGVLACLGTLLGPFAFVVSAHTLALTPEFAFLLRGRTPTRSFILPFDWFCVLRPVHVPTNSTV